MIKTIKIIKPFQDKILIKPSHKYEVELSVVPADGDDDHQVCKNQCHLHPLSPQTVTSN